MSQPSYPPPPGPAAVPGKPAIPPAANRAFVATMVGAALSVVFALSIMSTTSTGGLIYLLFSAIWVWMAIGIRNGGNYARITSIVLFVLFTIDVIIDLAVAGAANDANSTFGTHFNTFPVVIQCFDWVAGLVALIFMWNRENALFFAGPTVVVVQQQQPGWGPQPGAGYPQGYAPPVQQQPAPGWGPQGGYPQQQVPQQMPQQMPQSMPPGQQPMPPMAPPSVGPGGQ